jgi:hypothetical protein
MDDDALRAWLDARTAGCEFSGAALVWRDGGPQFVIVVCNRDRGAWAVAKRLIAELGVTDPRS